MKMLAALALFLVAACQMGGRRAPTDGFVLGEPYEYKGVVAKVTAINECRLEPNMITVAGELVNGSGRDLQMVAVSVSLLDVDGAKLGETHAIASGGLSSGQTWKFTAQGGFTALPHKVAVTKISATVPAPEPKTAAK